MREAIHSEAPQENFRTEILLSLFNQHLTNTDQALSAKQL